MQEVAERTGFTVGTLRNLVAAGVAPPPTMRIGKSGLWSPEDVKFFRQSYRGRPWLRLVNRRKKPRT